MDNFDYKKYVSSGRIYKDVSKDDKLISESENISEKKKKEGYDAREDESLGDRRGKESGKKKITKLVEMTLTVNSAKEMLKLKVKLKDLVEIK